MRNTNKGGLFARVFLLLLLPLPCSAQTAYSDSFEGPGVNTFWTLTQAQGTVSLSTDVAHTGSQSIKFASSSGGQRELHLTHVFPAPLQGMFAVWFYDTAPGQQTLYEQLALSNSTQPGLSGFIGTDDFDANCYNAALNSPGSSFGENARCGTFPQLLTTSVPRTIGWHLLSIAASSTATTFSIDGTVVFAASGNYAFDTVDLAVKGPSFRPDTVAYFDDFSFSPSGGNNALYAATVLADQPIAYLRLGDRPGAVAAADVSGFGHTGSYEGDAVLGVPGLITGDSDPAVRFGTTGAVTIADTPNLDFPGTPFTIEAWVSGISSGDASERIFDKTIAGTGNGYGIDISNVQLRLLGSTSLSPLRAFDPNTTYHIVGVSDGAATGYLYVNGALVNTGPYSSSLPYTGAAHIAVANDGTAHFGGTIDEVAVYNHVLSPERVLAHYQAGTSGPPSGCVAAITPSSQQFGITSAFSSFHITASGACTGTATTQDAWITVLPGRFACPFVVGPGLPPCEPPLGSGSGSISFGVAANPSTSARIGHITADGQTFTVTQSAASSLCTFSVSPGSLGMPAGGGTATVTVVVYDGVNCNWNASVDPASAGAMRITSAASGTGNGVVKFSVSPNPSSNARTLAATVGGHSISVVQAGTGMSSVCGATDVTGPSGAVQVAQQGLTWYPLMFGGSVGSQVVTLTNTSSMLISNVYYVMHNIPHFDPQNFGYDLSVSIASEVGVGLIDDALTTACYRPSGETMLPVGNLGPHQTVKLGLEFLGTGITTPSGYVSTVLSGTPNK